MKEDINIKILQMIPSKSYINSSLFQTKYNEFIKKKKYVKQIYNEITKNEQHINSLENDIQRILTNRKVSFRRKKKILFTSKFIIMILIFACFIYFIQTRISIIQYDSVQIVKWKYVDKINYGIKKYYIS